MSIKVSQLLSSNIIVEKDITPTLGGNLNVNNFTISNGSNFVNISGNNYPKTVGSPGQLLSTDGSGNIIYVAPVSYTAGNGLVLSGSQFSLSSPVAVSSGGTGLASVGSANQILGVNNAGTGTEYKTVSAGTGVSILNTTGNITVNNTGVTSVGLLDSSVTPILSIISTPVTTAGNLSFALLPQAANTVLAGIDGIIGEPTFRTLVFGDLGNAIRLYRELVVTPTLPIASGNNSVAIGNSSKASASCGIAFGDGTDAKVFGQKAYANGKFATAGDAQHGVYILRNITTDDAVTELYLNGVAATQRLLLSANSMFTFAIQVAAKRTDSPDYAGFTFTGVVKRDANIGSSAFVGYPSKTALASTDVLFDAYIQVDSSTGAFKVFVIGQPSKTIRWVATVLTTEITN